MNKVISMIYPKDAAGSESLAAFGDWCWSVDVLLVTFGSLVLPAEVRDSKNTRCL